MKHRMNQHGILLSVALFASIMFGVFGTPALGQSESAEQPIAQEELMRQVLATAEGDRLVWVRRVQFAPGTEMEAEPIIEHPAEEFVYVLEGTAELNRAGEEPRTFRPGEAWHNEFEQTHTLANASDTEPLTVLVVWVGEEGAF